MLRVRAPWPAFRHRLTSTDCSRQQQHLQRFPADLLGALFCQQLPCLCCDCRELVQAAVQAFTPLFPWLSPVGYEVHRPVEVTAIHPKRRRHRVAADRCKWTSSGQLSSVAWRLEPCGVRHPLCSSVFRMCAAWREHPPCVRDHRALRCRRQPSRNQVFGSKRKAR